MRTFDWQSLRGHIIAINYAAIMLPQATYCYFANLDWFERFRSELRVHRGIKIAGSEDPGVPWVRHMPCTELEGLNGGGGNSGYAAVTRAYQLGYRHMTLLGYDFLEGSAIGNFHDTHTWTNHTPVYWRGLFHRLLPELEKRGVTIVTPKGPHLRF